MEAGISAAAALDFVVAKSGVGGGIDATVNINLNDTDGDGRVRINEIVQNFKTGPQCVFDFDGDLTAGLFAFVEVTAGPVTVLDERLDIAEVTLLDFNYSCEVQPPVLATKTGGTLNLNIGSRAGDRKHGDTSDGPETFNIERGGNSQEVVVSAFGYRQSDIGDRERCSCNPEILMLQDIAPPNDPLFAHRQKVLLVQLASRKLWQPVGGCRSGKLHLHSPGAKPFIESAYLFDKRVNVFSNCYRHAGVTMMPDVSS